MSVYVIGDTHWWHKNIRVYESIRLQLGETLEDMNWEIVKRWNSVVTPEDQVIHLGDVAFQVGTKFDDICRLVKACNGIKTLIKGNHDHAPDDKYLEMGFSMVYSGPKYYDGYVLSHEPILDTKILNIHGHLHHYPNPDKPSHRPKESPEPNSKLHFNASIEMLPGMKPMLLSDIIEKMV